MKPVLRLRLHVTQSQPCFPAASNAFALPGGNLIFAATPTERITHYTLIHTIRKNEAIASGRAPGVDLSPLKKRRSTGSCYYISLVYGRRPLECCQTSA